MEICGIVNSCGIRSYRKICIEKVLQGGTVARRAGSFCEFGFSRILNTVDIVFVVFNPNCNIQ
jgi:hypothetical protein